MDRSATNRQLWALFCITKKDHRDMNLTVDQASELIAQAKASINAKREDAINIYNEALKAGQKALEACTPVPMIVGQHANVFNDHSPVTQTWNVPDGVCGFAWITIRLKDSKRRTFINQLKKAGLASSDINCFDRKVRFKKDDYYGGYTLWIREGDQSMQRKEAFAYAFANILSDHGIEAQVGSRMD